VNGRELARDFLPNNSDPRRDVFDMSELVVPGPNEITIVYSETSSAHTAYWFYSLTVRS